MRNAFEIQDRLLATGPNGGGVALLAGRSSALLREGDATGLAVGRIRLAWCLQGPGPTRLREFMDGSLRERRLAEEDLDLHDLLEDDDGWCAVATAANAIVRVDAAGLRELCRFSDVADSWHLNSLARWRGELVASAFGRFASHRGYKGATAGTGEVLRVSDGATLFGGLSQPHSLVADGDALWLCNSEAGEVWQVVDGEVCTRWTLPGYTRGLALGARHAYVGLSLSRNPGAERDGQRFPSAVVAVVDRRDGRVEGYLALPWREIYDLRLLPDDGMAESLLMAQLGEAPLRAPMAGAASAVDLAPLSEALGRQHAEVIHAISHEIHLMQATTAAAMQQLGAEEGGAAAVAALDARLLALPADIEAATAPALLTALDHAAERIAAEVAIARDAAADGAIAVAALRDAVERGEDRLEARLAAFDDLPPALAALAPRLDAMQGQLQEAVSPLRAALVGMGAALEARAEAQVAATVAGHASLAAAIDALRQSLEEARATLRERDDALAAALAGADRRDAEHRAALAGLGAVLESRSEAQIAAMAAGQASLAATIASLRGALDEIRASLRERDAALAAAIASADRRDAEHRDAIASAREEGARRERALGEALEVARRDHDTLRQALEAETASVKHHKEFHMQQQHEHAANLEHLQAELARRDDELHALRHEVEHLRESHLTLQQVLGSASWRWTRPLRAAARLLRGDWGQDSSARLGKMVRDVVARAPGLSEDARSALIERSLNLGQGAHVPALLPDRHLAPHLALAAPVDGLPDVFVWAVIDWHFRVQRPQHLARALAERGHRVFYMSNNFVDAAEPGFHVQPLDADGRLFQVHLALAGAPAIYYGLPSDTQAEALHASLATLLAWTCTPASLSLVQHAYWTPLVRSVPNARVVYDCMDHHAGFEDNAPAVLQAEQALVADADLVIVTSAWLHDEIAPKARATALVRNAGEYEHFRTAPAEVFRDEQGRRVIGYYGAIAEWFDLALVRAVALAQPDALVLLVGNDTAGAAAALADLPNVRLVGEVPYAELPYWLHGFDVALLPFKVIPLTLATNPVKVYEYLAAGVPVVAVDLPEMAQFNGLVRVAADHAGFVAAVGDALDEPREAGDVAARQAFAAGQTWAHRARALDEALEGIREPRVSVIVLTYNNLAFTDACLFSIEAYSDYPDLEVIVVDNASSDGSREWLQRWVDEPSKAGHTRRLILNDDNLGFAAGNNVGLAAATGEVLVMLNNDTYATPGWVRGLCNHLRREPGLGLVGPVTNNIGNEAKLDIHYADMVEMIRLAGQHTRQHAGRRLEIPTVAFFCVAMPRSVYERVGGLDEAFGVGFFEDDDYCRRVAQAGWRVACADDVFVHHHLSASFDKLKAEAKQALFERNKAIFEAKWGPWQPHVYRARA